MIKFLPIVYALSGYQPVKRIVVLGCGGTGAFVVSHLARFLSVWRPEGSSDYGRLVVPDLFLIDGDEVEEKNLVRQHFIYQDVGKNKAEVLAERYSAAFGIDINVVPKDIEDEESLFKIFNTNGIIIGCVDNNATRQLIHNAYFSKNNVGESMFWIDSGNKETAGQVVCGYASSSYYYGSNRLNKIRVGDEKTSGEFSLPCTTEIYPEFLDEGQGFNSELSCAERAESAPQNMMTNVTAATIAMNFAQTIIMGKELKAHAVDFSIKNTFTTRLNTEENLKIINPKRKREWEM